MKLENVRGSDLCQNCENTWYYVNDTKESCLGLDKKIKLFQCNVCYAQRYVRCAHQFCGISLGYMVFATVSLSCITTSAMALFLSLQ